ncbi:Por secretion system C-terminal sorting domain-containing protein [Flaviramulus basaltis]|uniref:Por secretion system C-terminal sorting domain-containing protein n=1 Tax=Flaviramulus basaltis TaxID=369401 RepID=A0A1K2IPH5_9FLAO|nr:T9SS-dependent M36 family metallopeptidase [Flaviramulus basaltis]SFZ94337.1 Por secretion system C-terminal sorting domain-containing protein [Flaviramulus basaltis]
MKKHYVLLFLFSLSIYQLVNAQEKLTEHRYYNVVKNYVDSNKKSSNKTSYNYQDLLVKREVYSKRSKVTHLYLAQTYQGVEIHNAISSVSIKNDKVFFFGERSINNINSKVNTTTPQLNAKQAIIAAAEKLNLGSVGVLEEISSKNNSYKFSKGNISESEIPVKLVYQPVNNGKGLKLAWDIFIQTTDGKNWWSVRIDATTGEILDKQDMVVSCKFHTPETNIKSGTLKNTIPTIQNAYRQSQMTDDSAQYYVLPLPVESPNHGSFQLVTNPADAIASPFGWHDTDGVDGSEYTITRGNNVYAREDRDFNNSGGYSPDGTSTLDFNFPFDINNQPIEYEDVAITNLFYVNNMMHDISYAYGFDEAAGNFQELNYTGEGLGGDYVIADAQDYGALNNAVFSTYVEGVSPRMQMFLWSRSGEIGQPLTINNGSLAGSYYGLEALFGESLVAEPITTDLVVVEGTTTGDYEACGGISNSSEISGKIAVIRRGNCQFGFKVLQAQNFGAIAAIIVNSDDTFYNMTEGTFGGNVNIPSILINQTDGEAIISALLNSETINASLVSAPPYYKDGDFDNLIIAHEYTHGITKRLTGGADNASCLTNPEHMGEGWSDWYALMITIQDPNNVDRSAGTYTLGQDTDGGGFRAAKYSPNFTVNNYTYGATNDETLLADGSTKWNASVHNIGFVWGTILWDLSLKYIDKYGYDPDVINGTGGNNKILQVVTDALKIQVCSPGFVDGRDAILAADMALTGGEDQCMIWEAFANRGVGYNASQGESDSMIDQIEDFTLPPDTDASLANCTTLSTEDFELNKYGLKIYPNPVNNTIYFAANESYNNVNIQLADVTGRMVLKGKMETLNNQTKLNVSALPTGIYFLNITGNNIKYVKKIIKK